MENRIEERLPQVVEDRLQEAYSKIREGKVEQMKSKKKHSIQRFGGIAAACAVLVVGSIGVAATAAYFQKEVHQEAGETTYEFSVNYELIPGEYKITPSYLPEGFSEQEEGKYRDNKDSWITIMPIYTTAELDRLGGKIEIGKGQTVEHATLSGMEADIITYEEAEKYESNTDIYLFNPVEGCVIQIVASYSMDKEELLKFADSLSIERTGDAAFESAEEKEARQQEEAKEEQQMADGEKTMAELLEAGIPKEKVYGIGEELTYGGVGFTLLNVEYLDSIEGFPEENFFDFSRFEGWVTEDKTLKPYTRQHYDADYQLVGEEQAEQRILKVEIKAHCYDNDWWEEVPLDFRMINVIKRADGSLTWDRDSYEPVPSEHNDLHMDQSAVYLDKTSHREGEDRKSYFFSKMEAGEELTYTLLFVVDKDREGQFVIAPFSANNSFEQISTMSKDEVLAELEGYFQL